VHIKSSHIIVIVIIIILELFTVTSCMQLRFLFWTQCINSFLLPLPKGLGFARRVSVCLCVCLQLHIKLVIGSLWKFYQRCICRHGRTDQILEVVHLRSRIQEFFKEFLTLQEGIFPQFCSHLWKNSSDLREKFYRRCFFLNPVHINSVIRSLDPCDLENLISLPCPKKQGSPR